MPQPLVSIVINNYNYGDFIKAAIDSALAQTYKNVEVIVVDDGSTDQSRAVISSFGERINSIFQDNAGQGAAINTGFKASRGEIICLLDSDDTWLSSKVAQVVQQFQLSPLASTVHHPVQNCNSQGHITGSPWPHAHYRQTNGDIADMVLQAGGQWPAPPTSALSFSRKYLSQVLEIPEEDYQICADAYLTDLAPFYGEVIGINSALTLYRLHGSNHWAGCKDLNNRTIRLWEMRTQCTNKVLQKSNKSYQIDLAYNLQYQRIRAAMGEESNRWELIRLMLRNPWETRFYSRLKMVFSLWLSLSIRKMS